MKDLHTTTSTKAVKPSNLYIADDADVTSINIADIVIMMRQLINENKTINKDITDIKKVLRMLLSSCGEKIDEGYRYGN